MDLDQQIQILINDATQHGIHPQVIASVAPGLKELAEKLRHREYYILQNFEGSWVLTTLSNRATPELTKRVIYAFPSLKGIPANIAGGLDFEVMALPVPVTHILFQMIALETVDSTIFFETPNDLTTGVEIQRQQVQTLFQVQLKQISPPSHLPPDIA